jgi:hypothetical protein
MIMPGIGVRKLGVGDCLLGSKSKLLSITETKSDGQEGDIVTTGKVRTLVLTNGDLHESKNTSNSVLQPCVV